MLSKQFSRRLGLIFALPLRPEISSLGWSSFVGGGQSIHIPSPGTISLWY